MTSFSTLRSVGRATLFAGLLSIPTWVQAESTAKTILLENCGQQLALSEPPQRVVTVGQATTEMLYSLGLGDRVVGTSNWFTDVAPEFEKIDSGIERIAENFPSFEGVMARKPDLVTADFLFTVGPNGVVGKREQFHKLGVNTYVLASQCIDQDTSKGIDGVRTALFSLDSLYRSIRDIASLFRVEPRGEALIESIRQREAMAIASAEPYRQQGLSGVVWYSSAALGVDPWVGGSKGVPAWMMASLGVENVIDSDEVWPMVGWESIAKANPDFIVIAKMDRRRFEADDYKKKLKFLRTDPVTREMDAVKNDHIIVMDAHAMEVTLRSVAGLEVLSKAIVELNSAER
ncbi:ABC transporter substrate-binding protein [Oceanospirillum linum]|uniref:ABC transporter substrate-binding protein n=1 Tax=Oceanospirillum linum TaxID=966 RepID=A0A1T1H8D1_OCELI|nr:ABC transporter substrate-binding protein [Oceanospirillum linum]OOV85967.1 ABC transporter substrate-binding protein [Oceanospirillum linum]SEG44829.1 iron complex transport system substrate-binding protein [Oleiphilus messinensis]SMP34411.1 iron complex transport system substrate-binding protein [Oceanospirillum linum]